MDPRIQVNQAAEWIYCTIIKGKEESKDVKFILDLIKQKFKKTRSRFGFDYEEGDKFLD